MSDQIWLAIITTIGGICLEYLRRIHKKVTACGEPECKRIIAVVRQSEADAAGSAAGKAAIQICSKEL